jgi:two-component system KDP operon response regulator KdpE
MHYPHILIVDDDPGIIKLLRASFREMDYEILIAMDGSEALQTIQKELPDLIILGMTLSKIDGLEVCRQLRQWSQIPVIMLSSDDTPEQKVKCLDLGVDDYIIKPFNLDELIARVRALLRRIQVVRNTPTEPVFTAGDLEVNFAERYVTLAGIEIKCTPTEYNMLKELILNVGKVLTHTQLLKSLWGQEYNGEIEYLRVFINRLRAKIEPDPTNPRFIITVPGIGYMFNRRNLNQPQVLTTSGAGERRSL